MKPGTSPNMRDTPPVIWQISNTINLTPSSIHMPQTDKSDHSPSFPQPRFRWTTDPTFYPTARLAMEAPRERFAYVAALAPDHKSRSDALLVVDVDANSASYGSVVSRLDLPDVGDELHHFGWGACRAALCPYAPQP